MREQALLDALQAARTRLKSPFSTYSELKATLRDVLDALDLLPPGHTSSSSSSSTGNSVQLSSKARDTLVKHLSGIHAALLGTVLPVWAGHLEDDAEGWELVEQLVAPARHAARSGKAAQQSTLASTIALSPYHAISTCLAGTETKGFMLDILLRLAAGLVAQYGVREVYSGIYEAGGASGSAAKGEQGAARAALHWEEAVSTLVGLPARIANAVGQAEAESGQRRRVEVPVELEARPYFDKLCSDLQELALELDVAGTDDLSPLATLIAKLHRIGIFQSPAPSTDSRRPSFFTPMFPALLARLATGTRDTTATHFSSTFWPRLLDNLPTPVFVALAWSFLLHLTAHIHPSGQGPTPSSGIASAASFMADMLGPPDPYNTRWQPLLGEVFLTRAKGREDTEGMEARVRVIIAWIDKGGDAARGAFLDRLVEIWSDTREIKFGLFGRLKYITHLLILTLSLFPFGHTKIASLAFHSSLLLSIQHYLSHSDPAVRRLGMLVAEVVSGMTIEESEADRNARDERNAEREKKRRRVADPKSKEDAIGEFDSMMGDLDLDTENGAAPAKPSKKPSSDPKVQRLDFGPTIWDGTGEGREECRYLRSFVGLRDAQAEASTANENLLGWSEPQTPALTPDQPTVTALAKQASTPRGRSPERKKTRPAPEQPDSDDESLVGYSSHSEPSSSRSPSPTPSYLEEIAADPMLNMNTREKVERPVYIPQLVDLLKAREDPDKLEMALKWGESLIRRKRDFGKELAENAAEAATALLNLNDNFDIDDFEERRQGMLIALVTAVPRVVAPRIIELYFDAQYSLAQRSAILTGLAMGAREAAGMDPVVKPIVPKVDFPTKLLPPALHRQYIEDNRRSGAGAAFGLLDAATQEVSNKLLDRKGSEAADKVDEQFVRQRQLRVGRAQIAGKTGPSDDQGAVSLPPATTPYKDVAAENFILPMINRFWNYFESAVAREARNRGSQYAAGTGMVLSPFAVSKFLSTLAIMVHAARLSTAFLAIIAPATLELALMVGSMLRGDDEADALVQQGVAGQQADADVIGAALELALVTLDTSKDLDGGRTLSTDHMDALNATGNWAGKIFESEDRGELTTINAGGKSEGRTQKAAAGVVVLISEIVDQARHLRGWTMS